MSISLIVSGEVRAGETQETLISEHAGWRVIHNVYPNGGESCAVVTFDDPKSGLLVGMIDNREIIALAKLGAPSNGDLRLGIEDGGQGYEIRFGRVIFPDGDDGSGLIDRLARPPVSRLSIFEPDSGRHLADFSEEGAAEAISDMFHCAEKFVSR